MNYNKVKKILYIGKYDEDYSRSSIFLKGLRNNGIKIYEFNFNTFNFFKNLMFLIKNFQNLKKINFDFIITHSTNLFQYLISKYLAKLKKKPFIYDIYVSKLQTFYYDRKLYGKNKMPKILYPPFFYLQDFIESNFANYLILDTYAHIKFFHEKFNIPIKKFRRIFIGADNEIFFPQNRDSFDQSNFIVGFWGTFIPLQGIQYIIGAAKILENEKDIKFIIIGKGQTYKEILNLTKKLKLNNVDFLGYIPLRNLPSIIKNFDIGLGIFGNTPKTLQVIPNKIYEGNAMKIPMISCDSPAIRELFKDMENIVLCDRANPESLANAILKLKNNKKLRTKIKENAYNVFINTCSIKAIGKGLIRILNHILRGQK